MNGKFGKKKAGGIALNSSVIMIVSVLAATLFIGAAVQPAISGSKADLNFGQTAVKEEHIPCGCEEPVPKDAGCKTCVEAIFHAVKYMKGHVNNYIQYLRSNGTYLLWTMDLAIEIFEGLRLGIQDSGFKIKINLTELNNTINIWVNKLWGPQMHLITRISARLVAIYIGITMYLLTFCY